MVYDREEKDIPKRICENIALIQEKLSIPAFNEITNLFCYLSVMATCLYDRDSPYKKFSEINFSRKEMDEFGIDKSTTSINDFLHNFRNSIAHFSSNVSFLGTKETGITTLSMMNNHSWSWEISASKLIDFIKLLQKCRLSFLS